jgi:hypothetical protein
MSYKIRYEGEYIGKEESYTGRDRSSEMLDKFSSKEMKVFPSGNSSCIYNYSRILRYYWKIRKLYIGIIKL